MSKWSKPGPYLIKYTEKTFIFKGPGFTEIAKAVTDKGKKIRFSARGTSMSPFIKDGDLITVSPQKERRLKKGDIVAFYDPGHNHKLYVHRIIDIKKDRYQIKGDNLLTPDGFFSLDKILGFISEVLRGGKKISFGIKWGAKEVSAFSRWGILLPVLHVTRRVRAIFPGGYRAEK